MIERACLWLAGWLVVATAGKGTREHCVEVTRLLEPGKFLHRNPRSRSMHMYASGRLLSLIDLHVGTPYTAVNRSLDLKLSCLCTVRTVVLARGGASTDLVLWVTYTCTCTQYSNAWHMMKSYARTHARTHVHVSSTHNTRGTLTNATFPSNTRTHLCGSSH